MEKEKEGRRRRDSEREKERERGRGGERALISVRSVKVSKGKYGRHR